VTGGIKVHVRLTPKSGHDGVEGIQDTAQGPALKVRVRAIAEDGQANTATCKVVADWLGVPKSRVEVAAGGRSRIKMLAIAGDAAELERLIAQRVAALAGK
jgi:uncharacterized protein YggU (UPF0235/DUF167 family)